MWPRGAIAALREVARRLADVMALPLVWIGRLEPGVSTVCVVGAAGPARACGEILKSELLRGIDTWLHRKHRRARHSGWN